LQTHFAQGLVWVWPDNLLAWMLQYLNFKMNRNINSYAAFQTQVAQGLLWVWPELLLACMLQYLNLKMTNIDITILCCVAKRRLGRA
jgi:phenylpropionate dioxygenase-like ring-hydroxylating dioxygenase large terminal subunit